MTDWKNKSLAHWEMINRMAVRRFGGSACAEEAALFVVDGLAANDWRRVRNHDGRASFKGYLASLTWRLLEE
ncbi:MAG: hypothetical protein ABFS19_11560, partial [Thermodesulfobacteriota bacterium]